MNRIEKLFSEKQKDILNIYFTAGFPKLEDTGKIISKLQDAGVDLIELGMPYSDPLADGETIQASSSIALKNGMQLDILFEQVKKARTDHDIPIMLMGYYNQLIQYGEDKFLDNCVDSGIDGLIVPDIPLSYYESNLESKLKERDIKMTFLVTPETGKERTILADKMSSAFLYVVAKSSITGNTNDITDQQETYFQSLDNLNLKAPRLIGFGIHDHASFMQASQHANGAIIGSAFIRMLDEAGIDGVSNFVSNIRGKVHK